ncbi:prolipoprotein diacylglyceryl transferase [Fulvivirga ligni]|uniref:prolipoprotein diacylglyceryl transferase n=1 Tax=Fulvivirga ligni TaxID=2904246 RepID=UPI001F185461|nr:prolipoprotein diacylglyceryl transferase [Fulvivirga ligni]UII23631.1 prolipoprotein diacylglyceryl transferase [Fulvivirga ligni]
MAYITWAPDKEIIDLGFYALRWYSLLFALGFVLSFYLLRKQFKKAELDESYLEKLTMYLVLATVIGARLAHCLFYDFDYYSQHILEIFLPVKFDPFRFVGFQGLASHGGILGVFIATVLFCRKYKVKPLWLLDRLSVVGALAGCCIRLGNLMNSEIVGSPSDVPWAFIFKEVDNVPRHPGQLYEALAYLSIFAILSIVLKKSNRHNGFIFGLFFTLLFIARFLIEFVKADQSAFEAGWLFNMGQLLSIPFIIFGIVMMYLKRGKRDPEENAAKTE